jgi:hypothetical protein
VELCFDFLCSQDMIFFSSKQPCPSFAQAKLSLCDLPESLNTSLFCWKEEVCQFLPQSQVDRGAARRNLEALFSPLNPRSKATCYPRIRGRNGCCYTFKPWYSRKKRP